LCEGATHSVIEDEFVVALEIASALEEAGFSGVEQVDNEARGSGSDSL
jgi:hypothetical protein